jgi:hypothetical protein
VVQMDYCNLIGSPDCLESCGCCDDPSLCGESDAATREKLMASLNVAV